MKNNVRFSLRNKLFLFVVIAFSLLITLTIWQVRQQAKSASESSTESSLSQSTTILNTFVDSQFFSIKEVANSISKDGRVLPLVFEKDSPTLQDLSVELKSAFEFDSLFFISDRGEVLARSDRPEAIGMNLLGKSALFDNALQGNSSRGIIVSGGKILQIVVEPIFDNVARDVIRGLVAVAYELSMEMMENIQTLTSSDIGLFLFNRDDSRNITGAANVHLTNQNLRNELQAYFSELKNPWEQLDENKTQRLTIELNKEVYFSVVKLLSSFEGRPLGFLVTLRSQKDLMEPFTRIENSVLIIGIICLLVAIFIAMFLSYQISEPLLKLVKMTTDIQQGIFPQQKPSTKKPNDEIELLYNSVVKMGSSIKEKNELESYLSGLAPTVERVSLDDVESNMPVLDNGANLKKMSKDAASKPTKKLSKNADQARSTTSPKADDCLDETIVRGKESLDETVAAHRTKKTNGKRSIDTIEVSDVIDKRYRLLQCVGEGVFGKVFLAKDMHLSENIAIKIMDKQRLERSQIGLHIHEEIKLARRITHRNITRTYDFGNFNNFLYITMEYVDGYTLNELVDQNGTIAAYPATILVKQLCSAMHAAHDQGIIHRDLKPQNIAISQQGVLKIMDFGLAVSIHSISAEQREVIQQTAAGTPKFMAPEQFVGGELDERTDIYALGGLAYYVLAGRAPFSASSLERMAQLHQTAPVPSLLAEYPNLPTEVDAIIQKAMQKDPNNRFHTAKDMFDALNAINSIHA